MAGTECGACGSVDLRRWGAIDFYTARCTIRTDLVKCRACGTLFRDLDPGADEAVTHFDVASYTNPQNDKLFWHMRADFFRFLCRSCSRISRASPHRPRLLDVGCAFGHMMDVFSSEGYDVCGVEIVSTLRETVRRKGYRVYSSYEDISETERFDVIAMVDSLYCFNNPLHALRKLRPNLTDDGILLLRVTNRAWLINCLHFLRRPVTSSSLGDSKFCFSPQGIRILCRRAGYRVEKTILREQGKKISSPLKKILYGVSPALSQMSGCILSPGIVLLCRKNVS